MPQVLGVCLHGARAGRLTRSRRGVLLFAYDARRLERDGPLLSAALPPRPGVFRGRAARAYFFGALTDFAFWRRTSGHLLRYRRRVFPGPEQARVRMEDSLEALEGRYLEQAPYVRRQLEERTGGTRAEWHAICAGVCRHAQRVLERIASPDGSRSLMGDCI